MVGLLALLLAVMLLSSGRGQRGGGCGPTTLGLESGTLASRNYPGTYPNSTRCEWHIKAAEGSNLTVIFGDLDLEYSPRCTSGSLTISSQGISYGPYCGNLNQTPGTLRVNSSEASVLFSSGTHRSGRGFLLSYASSHHPDPISCLEKGVHYSIKHVSVYCPAGCKEIAGDIWGQVAHGYRDTSVICKAAVHAGAISDDVGGQVTFIREKGITLYEAAAANGLQSKTGSLSEKRLLFGRDCDESLDVAVFRSSSAWRDVDAGGQPLVWTAERASFDAVGAPHSWAADGGSSGEWLEIDLGGRRNITGIVTRGSPDSGYNFYTMTYRVLSSRDGKTWKVYKPSSGTEERVFEGNTDSQQATLNNFIPPIVSRYLRIAPQSWNIRAALKVKVLGCVATRTRSTRPNVYVAPREISTVSSVPQDHSTFPSVEIRLDGADPALMLILILVGLVLITTGLLLFGFLCYKKRKAAAEGSCGCMKGYQKPQSSQVCCRPHLHPSDSELISYSDDGSPGGISAAHSPDYAVPDVIPGGINAQKVPSTFKPAPDEGYTLPLVVSHYDVPGRFHEYTEPLPSEPEYATPFTDQALATAARKNICIVKVIPPAQGKKAPQLTCGLPGQYDSPSQRRAAEEVDCQAEGLVVPDGHCKEGGQGLPDRTLTGRGVACRELPPVPWGHFKTRDSLPHVYQEPL
ncbi:hypothetical protein NDU88_001287 [Pleurodeles waltl]|uniref:Uncharacterized protein n=1 Tax=Pleurodeles waltl TaxID=8319 RepID=A0AAV7TJP9_PLEWA|nr:hypothetical protein NDU88_001287 [Pleurodeles waltl]